MNNRTIIIDDETAGQLVVPSRQTLPTLDQLLEWEEQSLAPPKSEVAVDLPQETSADQSSEWTMAMSAPSEEGQLAVDVIETTEELLIISTIAGVRAQDIQIVLQQDLLTIRGMRAHPMSECSYQPLIEECYWGPFSRTLILPTAVDPSRVQARLAQGVLTIQLTKLSIPDTISVVEMDEEDEEEDEDNSDEEE